MDQLIDNALAAMGQAGVLTVRTRLDRDQAPVEFGDTGPGVPPQIQERPRTHYAAANSS